MLLCWYKRQGLEVHLGFYLFAHLQLTELQLSVRLHLSHHQLRGRRRGAVDGRDPTTVDGEHVQVRAVNVHGYVSCKEISFSRNG